MLFSGPVWATTLLALTNFTIRGNDGQHFSSHSLHCLQKPCSSMAAPASYHILDVILMVSAMEPQEFCNWCDWIGHAPLDPLLLWHTLSRSQRRSERFVPVLSLFFDTETFLILECVTQAEECQLNSVMVWVLAFPVLAWIKSLTHCCHTHTQKSIIMKTHLSLSCTCWDRKSQVYFFGVVFRRENCSWHDFCSWHSKLLFTLSEDWYLTKVKHMHTRLKRNSALCWRFQLGNRGIKLTNSMQI